MPRNITPNGRGLGWKGPSLPDPRDHLLAASPRVLSKLPPEVDLREGMPPVWDQGSIASCTAQSVAAVVQFDQRKQGLKEFTPSRLMLYYDTRELENAVNSDCGGTMRDAIKSIATQGACPEDEWPYDVGRWAEKPPDKCYADALKYKALSYKKLVRDLQEFKACLASGFPFVLGITLFESFESKAAEKSGKIPMPSPGERRIGGHAVVCCGYSDKLQSFLFRNHWGSSFGQDGYFYLFYQYLLNPGLSHDFFQISLVS